MDWNQLLFECQNDFELCKYKQVLSLLNSSDQYWQVIPLLLRECPYPLVDRVLIHAFVFIQTNSQFFHKTYRQLNEWLTMGWECGDIKQSKIIRLILDQWLKAFPASSMDDLMSLIFGIETLQQIDYCPEEREKYRKIVLTVYDQVPELVKFFFTSSKGQAFWRGIKRLESAGLLSSTTLNTIEEITLHLPMISDQPVNGISSH